jgi:hypothetical protein
MTPGADGSRRSHATPTACERLAANFGRRRAACEYVKFREEKFGGILFETRSEKVFPLSSLARRVPITTVGAARKRLRRRALLAVANLSAYEHRDVDDPGDPHGCPAGLRGGKHG